MKQEISAFRGGDGKRTRFAAFSCSKPFVYIYPVLYTGTRVANTAAKPLANWIATEQSQRTITFASTCSDVDNWCTTVVVVSLFGLHSLQAKPSQQAKRRLP